MMPECKEHCEQHSGNMEKFVNLEREINCIRSSLDNYKGYIEGRLLSTVSDMKDLRKELTDRMDAGFKKLEDKMDEKEKKSSDKKWIIMGTLISPLVVLFLQKISEYIIK